MSPSQATFDDTTENFTYWLRENANKVLIGVGIVVAAVAVTWFVRTNSARKDSRASLALGQAQVAAAQGSPAVAQQQLAEVAQRYKGTAAGTEAQLQLAQLQYDQGKYQDGLNALAKADAPKSMEVGVKLLTAVGYEGLNKFADAAKLYEEVANATQAAPEKSQYQANAARAYQAAGDKAAALRIWEELAKNEQPGIADEARVRVGELTAKALR
jgi:predicted negative regulator of RcsB-dependent stress response